MIPLSESAFWGPMATTIMGGLFVATFLTLLVLPALYALWFRKSLDAVAPQPVWRAEHALAARPRLAALQDRGGICELSPVGLRQYWQSIRPLLTR